MEISEGYIRLSRKFFRNDYWNKKRSFSQAEAWLDLIQMARFEAEPAKKTLPNGRQIVIERGEVHASLRFLSARWCWGLTQVRTYMRKAVETHQITQRVTQGENVITLLKYDVYNPLVFEKNTPDNTPSNTPDENSQHTDNTPTDTKNNKGNKEKERKKEEISSNEDICRDEPRHPPPKDDFKKFIAEFNQIKGSKYQTTKSVRQSFYARIKEGYTAEQMLQVLKNAMMMKNHIESGYRYITPEFCTRTAKLEMYINNAQSGNVNSVVSSDKLKNIINQLNNK